MVITIIISLIICFVAYRFLLGPYERPKYGYLKPIEKQDAPPDEPDHQPTRRRRRAIEHILEIDYVDSDGNMTTRIIEVPKRDRGGVGYLKAYCRLRGDERTFRLDRITRCVDIETGEIIEDIYKRLRKRQLI